jgi:amino acid permease
MAESLADETATLLSFAQPVEHRGSIRGTVINTVCNVIGVGILSIPKAMYDASLALGVVCILLFGVVSIISAYVIAVCCEQMKQFSMNALLSRSLCGSPESFLDEIEIIPELSSETERQLEAATKRADDWRSITSVLVDVAVTFNNFSCLVAYARVVSDSMPRVLRDFFHWSGAAVNSDLWLAIGGVIFALLTSKRTFSELKLFSVLGIATIMFMVVCVVIRYADSTPESLEITTAEQHDVRWFHFDSGFLQAFATLSTAYGYHYNAPIFYQELADRSPQRMLLTVLIAFPTIIVTYIVMGVLGYLSFGRAIANASAGGSIANNYGTFDTLMNVARFLLFFHFVSVFPVIAVNVRQCVHRLILRARGDKVRASDPEEVFRTPQLVIVAEAIAVVTAAVLIAAVVPGIDIVIEIAGALTGTFVLMTLPGIVGIYVFSAMEEQEVQLRLDGDCLDHIESDLAPFAFFPNLRFTPRGMYYVSCFLVCLGTFSTVGGLIAVFMGM